MQLTPQCTSWFHRAYKLCTLFRGCLDIGIILVITISAGALETQKSSEIPFGIAWQVRGLWHAEGRRAPIASGDAIGPGSLLRADGESAGHSIIILLPDGQRILYECFQVEDCARGFRVPALYRQPDPAAIEMFGRVHAALTDGKREPSLQVLPTSRLARDEALEVLGPGSQVEVGGMAATLANGRYTYDVRSWNPTYPRRSGLILQKTGPSIVLTLPSAGLYDVTISDSLNTPRINLFVAAVSPDHAASFLKSFRKAKSLLEDWNGDYQGWPIHDIQRAYLQSLLLGIQPRNEQLSGVEEVRPPDVTSEPILLPRPGLFKEDTSVSIKCVTPDATVHYTVDGSQPFKNSPVYRAPIMVKGTELTIKAYATAPGKRDSAVITGIFRIEQGAETDLQQP